MYFRTFFLVGKSFSLVDKLNHLVGKLLSLFGKLLSPVGKLLSLIGKLLSLVGKLLSLVGKSFSLVGKLMSLAGKPLYCIDIRLYCGVWCKIHFFTEFDQNKKSFPRPLYHLRKVFRWLGNSSSFSLTFSTSTTFFSCQVQLHLRESFQKNQILLSNQQWKFFYARIAIETTISSTFLITSSIMEKGWQGNLFW